MDNFGHSYIAGSARVLEDAVRQEIGCKVRSVELNLMQRCAAHISSATDIQESRLLGMTACHCALEGKSGRMASIQRVSDDPYRGKIHVGSGQRSFHREKKVPENFISPGGK